MIAGRVYFATRARLDSTASPETTDIENRSLAEYPELIQ